ncbi:MAG: hypothetical protein R6U98_01245, partial [Pirellulaceae bacterium]
QAVGFFRVESYPTQAVLPLVGLAAEKAIRDRIMPPKSRPTFPVHSTGLGQTDNGNVPARCGGS